MPKAATPSLGADIPGWFPALDRRLFEFFLSDAAPDETLDMLELGCYLGKSAVHIGAFLRPREQLYVCDLFDPRFKGLTRGKFEENYRSVRGDLPVVIQGATSEVAEYIRPRSLRFIHVDASHDYEDVRGDVDLAEDLLADGGVVAFDDYRTLHAPGVGAAVWGAVAQGRLTPLCVSRQKLYGTFGAPSPRLESAIETLADSKLATKTHSIAGRAVVRVSGANDAGNRDPAASADALKRLERRVKRLETASRPAPRLRGLQQRVAKVARLAQDARPHVR